MDDRECKKIIVYLCDAADSKWLFYCEVENLEIPNTLYMKEKTFIHMIEMRSSGPPLSSSLALFFLSRQSSGRRYLLRELFLAANGDPSWLQLQQFSLLFNLICPDSRDCVNNNAAAAAIEMCWCVSVHDATTQCDHEFEILVSFHSLLISSICALASSSGVSLFVRV